MFKVKKIITVTPYSIVCELNNGILKKLDILPLLEKHANFQGIDQLKNKATFESVAIGDMGELFWKNIITTSNNEKWDYDISPEFIFHNGITIDS
ncbi:DUF2442 domain-containing protein [Flavobacterium restrictum]|uniref:DUF2442 domain-containing protein n=1 Tax=Flavobacterium restrictum TaxID=2594428 RepID=A0A553DV48_9FLAO|nr:DUF2442 domain-containing protein [Flavobacterium restrictum]TRX36646.1 DUF2442 domain-containing protein [Flavobacterium restrictum]